MSRPDLALPYLRAWRRLAPQSERAQADRDVRTAEEQAKRLTPTVVAQKHYERGIDLSEAPGSDLQALRELSESYRLRPDFVAPRVLAARIMVRRGNFRDAIAILEEATAVLDARATGATGEDDKAIRADLEMYLARYRSERGK